MPMEQEPLHVRMEHERQLAQERNLERARQLDREYQPSPYADSPFSITRLVGGYFLGLAALSYFMGFSPAKWGASSSLIALLFAVAFFAAPRSIFIYLALALYWGYYLYPKATPIVDNMSPIASFFANPVTQWLFFLLYLCFALGGLAEYFKSRPKKNSLKKDSGM